MSYAPHVQLYLTITVPPTATPLPLHFTPRYPTSPHLPHPLRLQGWTGFADSSDAVAVTASDITGGAANTYTFNFRGLTAENINKYYHLCHYTCCEGGGEGVSVTNLTVSTLVTDVAVFGQSVRKERHGWSSLFLSSVAGGFNGTQDRLQILPSTATCPTDVVFSTTANG